MIIPTVPTITSTIRTKVVIQDTHTPFEVVFTPPVDAKNNDLQGMTLKWQALDQPNGSPVTGVLWDKTDCPLPLDAKLSDEQVREKLTSNFTIPASVTAKIFIQAVIVDSTPAPVATTPYSQITAKNINPFQPCTFVGDASSVHTGDINDARSVLTLTTIVKDKVDAPVQGMEVDFGFADNLDIVGTGTTFYNSAKNTPFSPDANGNVTPWMLTDINGQATVTVVCNKTHCLEFTSKTFGFHVENSSHTCVFENMEDTNGAKKAPSAVLDEGIYQIPEGTQTMEMELYPGKIATTDKVFLIVNDRLVDPVMMGDTANGSVAVPLAYLNLKSEVGENTAVYFVQNDSGTVSGSDWLPFGVSGNYDNKPDDQVKSRTAAQPELSPALPSGKTLNYDYLFLNATPGIRVKIPALSAGSGLLKQNITVVFYLNGYQQGTDIEISDRREVTVDENNKPLTGSTKDQYAILPATYALNYGESASGSNKRYFYCEYYYQYISTQELAYSTYISRPMDTSQP
ncbi:hypothetical protein [Enterobacter ludwigii]|uniref:hypothetical protein n=1 Tax=Enterobacter ludwigii TaxID=299767 RepID=UPI003F6E5C30